MLALLGRFLPRLGPLAKADAALFFSCVRAYREPGLGGAAVILLRIGLWTVGALVIGCTLYLLGSTVTIAAALLLQRY